MRVRIEKMSELPQVEPVIDEDFAERQKMRKSVGPNLGRRPKNEVVVSIVMTDFATDDSGTDLEDF